MALTPGLIAHPALLGITMSELRDPHGRRLQYLRFSLTEACNMACTYCLPDGYPEWYRHKARLSLADVKTVLAGFRLMDFRKVRFTGGEPTVHPGAREAVRLAREMGYEEVALTTNGTLLGDVASWQAAGLSHLNVSLDSLDPDTFHKLTKSRDHGKVLAALEDGMALGLNVKVNTVLMRGRNDHEIDGLLDWALQRQLTLRFIELMPTGLNDSFQKAARVLNSEILPRLEARGLRLIREGGGDSLLGPATDYGRPGLPGRIGLINPLSCNFCARCNRLRVTARGALRLCLFGNEDKPLDLAHPETVAASVRRAVERKERSHRLDEGDYGNVATFRTIGG